MPIKAAHWFESLSNAVTDGKVAEILRAKIDLIESQLSHATLRAEKAEANLLSLEEENKMLQRELAELRKAGRPKADAQDLPEGVVNVLQWIARHRGRGSDFLQRDLHIDNANMDYFVSILTRRNMIHRASYHPSEGYHYYATDLGLDYLASRNLL